MPVVTALVNSKTLHRVAGWQFFASAYDEMPDEIENPALIGFPKFSSVHIYSSAAGRGRIVGLPEEYPKYRWMFDEGLVKDGFTQIYRQSHNRSCDIHICLFERESDWLPELNYALRSQHLEIELLINQFLGRSELHIDSHGGHLLTFQAVPELTVSRKGPEE